MTETTAIIKIFKIAASNISKYSTTATAAGIKKKAILFVRNVPTSLMASIFINLVIKAINKIIIPIIVPGRNNWGKIALSPKEMISPNI